MTEDAAPADNAAAASREGCAESDGSARTAGSDPGCAATAASPRPGPHFDLDSAYGLVGELARLVDPHTEADPAAVYVSALVGLGNLIGPSPYFAIGAERHKPVLFALVVGATAKARKGTSWSEASRFLRLVDAGWSASRVMGGLGSGEALIAQLAPGGAASDDGSAPSPDDVRVMVVEEEWSRVLTICRREGSTLSEVIRSAWDGRTLANRTKRSAFVVQRHHVSVLGHITAEEFAARGRDLELANGLMNRFMFVHATRSKLLPSGGNLAEHALAGLVARTRSAVEAARKRGHVQRSTAAEHRWAEVYSQMNEDDPGGLVGAATARDAPIVLRLSLLFALLDEADFVEVPHVDAAWSLWQFSRSSAEYALGDALGDSDADRIFRALRLEPAGMTRTEVSALLGRHRTKAELDRALKLLVESGRATREAIRTAGRPRTVYRAHHARGGGDPAGSHEQDIAAFGAAPCSLGGSDHV